MAVLIGSARLDERNKAHGGAAGDQKQTSAPDYRGEVSIQNFYVHSKGWNVIRAKDAATAIRIASAMTRACNNKNVGYDQGQRLGIIATGTGSKVKTECDCSSLVRQCVKEATGKDPGNFNTASELNALNRTGLFDSHKYRSGETLYTGDILVTCTKGHTVIVTSGAGRQTAPAPAPAPAAAPTPKPQKANRLTVDGILGTESVKAMQRWLGTPVDGIVSGQLGSCAKYLLACPNGVWQYGKGGSMMVRALQRWLGVSADGYIGPGTIKALQRRLGVTADGYLGKGTAKALQTYLNTL